jgi:chorismate synthase
VARQVLAALVPGLKITGYMVQMGTKGIDRSRFDAAQIEAEPVLVPRCPVAAADWADYLDALRLSHNSVGAVIEVVAEGVPPGLGAPLYGKLDSDLAGGDDVDQRGQGRRDRRGHGRGRADRGRECRRDPHGAEGPEFLSNHAGGILGGISTGQPVVCRFAVKPTSSILTPRQTVTQPGRGARPDHQGPPRPLRRHPRVPVGEAMMACVLLDHLLLDRGQTGGVRGRIG